LIGFKQVLQVKIILKPDSSEESSAGRLFVPSLTLANFSLFIVDLIAGVFLLGVTATFFGSTDPVFVAITGQLATVASLVSAIFAVLLGVLSVKFNHKKLLVLGASCIPLGALGCSLAPNLIFLLVFFAIEGIGTTVVMVMTMTLVGEMLTLKKRPKATGWIMTGPSFAQMAGTLVISFFFADVRSWRSYLLWFALPVSLMALVAAFFGVPSSSTKRQRETVGREAFLSSFKQVFLNKSAAACLIGNMFTAASVMWAVYFVAFFMDRFGLSLATGALIAFGMAPTGILGLILGGYLVNKGGRRKLWLITSTISGITLPLFAFVPELWVLLIITYSREFIGAIGRPAVTNLTFEQAPESRGTMLSINNFLTWIGASIGGAVGGVALAFFGYTGVILTFASMLLIAVAIFFFLVEDPCITHQPDSMKPTLP
jgi:predicted MFS family arabinose efflux permease